MVTKTCKRCSKSLSIENFYNRHLACKTCTIAINRANYLRRVNDPEKKEALRERERINSKNYRERHPQRVLAFRRVSQRAYSLRHKFGITLKDYEAMLAKQNGACAVCGFVPDGADTYRQGKCLAVDHDHETGEIRGLLCDQCNRGIGQLKDDPELLARAVKYLLRGKPYVAGEVPETLRRYIEAIDEV